MAKTTAPRARSVQHYDRFRRFYDLPDGRAFPSVTTILEAAAKPALVPWAAKVERELVIESAAQLWEDAPVAPKMSRQAFIASLTNRLPKTRAHQKALTKAGEIGGGLHALIEWNLRRELGQEVGPEPIVKDAALWAFMAWEDFKKRTDFKPRAIEQVVWSTNHGYAGTMDSLAECTLGSERVLVVTDYKTGKAIYGEALLQNTAYVHAMIEMGHLEPPCCGLIVRLPKVESDPEPEFRLIPWEELEALFPVFLACKQLWTWMAAEDVKRSGAGKDVAGESAMTESTKSVGSSSTPAAVVITPPALLAKLTDPQPFTLLEEHVTGVPDAVVETGEPEDGPDGFLGGASAAPVPVTVVDDDGPAMHTGTGEPAGAGPLSPRRRLAGYQRSLLEYLQKAGKGELLKESKDGELFLWLPVSVLKILKFAKADEPLPVTLSELSVTEATGIMRAFMEVAKGKQKDG